MHIFRFIEKLRRKPEGKRQAIVLGVSVSITLVIAIFWIIALVIKIQNGGLSLVPAGANTQELDKSASDLKNSWSMFMSNINGIMGTVNGAVPTASAVISTSSTLLATTTDTGENI